MDKQTSTIKKSRCVCPKENKTKGIHISRCPHFKGMLASGAHRSKGKYCFICGKIGVFARNCLPKCARAQRKEQKNMQPCIQKCKQHTHNGIHSTRNDCLDKCQMEMAMADGQRHHGISNLNTCEKNNTLPPDELYWSESEWSDYSNSTMTNGQTGHNSVGFENVTDYTSSDDSSLYDYSN